MTTINNDLNILNSFFDIISKKNDIDIEYHLKNYATFAKETMQKKENFLHDSKQFWKTNFNKNTDIKSNEKIFTWVDIKELTENKNNLPCDVSRSAFKNLIETKTSLYVDNFSDFNFLDEILPNFKEVTDYYRGAFALNQSRSHELYEAPRPILLLGDPGIGKTYYAKQLAKIFNTNFQFIDSNAISASWVLCGHNKGWRGADAGLVFKLMAKSSSISPILLIDEFDKLNAGKYYDPSSIFHQMLEKENAKNFYDDFVELSFDASQIIYILTGNDKDTIPSTLLSRMTVFEIKNPNAEEMKKIIPTIYQNILAQSKMFKPFLEDCEINKLVNYTPRQVYQTISNNIYAQASTILKQGKKRKQPLIISELLPESRSIGF